MADATKLPNLTELTYFQWSTSAAPNPRLSAAISSTATTLSFTSAPLDEDGAVITDPFLIGVRSSDSYVETVYCPNGADGASGLSATGCIRGIELAGIDFAVGDTGNATSHEQDEAIFCNVTAVMQQVMVSALQGTLATGGSDFIIGTDADGTVTVSRSTGTGTFAGWLRFNTSTDQVQYSNNGSAWVNLADISASDLLKVSANDTTPGYLNGKLVAGTNVTLVEGNDGGDETLTVAASSQRDGAVTHIVYTPGYLTGGNLAESNFAVWNDETVGSFRITIDGGAAQNVDAIDFTGDTSMADVAATIQTALRVVTSSTETVVWDTDHFVITSVDTTSASAIAVLETSTGSVGTDISGAGAAAWMDAETGRGTATAAVLDETADSGKVALADTDGRLNSEMLDLFDEAAAKGEVFVSTAAGTGTRLTVGANGESLVADSAEGSGVKWGSAATLAKLSLSDSDVTVANTVTETDLISFSLPANTLGTDNGVKMVLFITDGDFTPGDTVTLRVKYGSTTIASKGITSVGIVTNRTGMIEFTLISGGTTSSQTGLMKYTIGGNGDSPDGATNRAIGYVYGTAAEDSTGALNMIVSAQWDTALTANSITMGAYYIYKIQ